jgi:WXG100 family type VII secretion target
VRVNVVHEAFQQGLGDVRQAVDQLARDEASIDRRISAFLGSGWTGVAAESFIDAWSEWKQGADRAVAGLDAMGDLMAAAYQDLVRQDDDSQARMDTVSARIVDRLGG